MNQLEKTLSEALCEANQEIERLKAIIAEREWQPIANWPKIDEAHALVCKVGSIFPVLAGYDANGDDWVSFNGHYEKDTGKGLCPTHWQPLPTPPETGK